MSGSKIHPHVEGQLKCLNLVKTLAADPDLIPSAADVKIYTAMDQFDWLKKLHKNLLKSVAEQGYMMGDRNVIHPSDVGRWREARHWVSETEMPNPYSIKQHLYELLLNIANFHDTNREKIEQPHLLNEDDIEALVEKAYEINLRLCCIKPFQDGSNRVARLAENVFRLNWGLPFKIIRHEDEFKLPYIDDIKKMQASYPAD